MANIPPPPPESQIYGNGNIPPPPPEEAIFGASQASAVPSIFQHVLNVAKTEGPPIAGGMMGAIAGAPFGPAGAIAGATLGGAGGRGWQRTMEYLTGERNPEKDTTLGNASDIAKSGIAQGAAEGVGQAVSAGLKAAAPAAKKLGAQVIKVLNGTPEKYGEAVLSKPEILTAAQGPKVASDAYKAFEDYTGLKGLDQMAGERAQEFGPSELYRTALGTANKIKAGQPVTLQEMYAASQAENQLNRLAKFGNPDAAAMLGSNSLSQAGKTIDEALETALPEYKNLRQGLFASKAREAFSKILPQNKNLSPNVLRTTTALGAAGYEAGKGNPVGAALPLIAISPALAGMAIRAAAAAAPAIAPAASLATRIAAQGLAENPTNSPQDTMPPEARAWLGVNTINLSKSGGLKNSLGDMKIPGVAKSSGKADIQTFADNFFDGDADRAIAALKQAARGQGQ